MNNFEKASIRERKYLQYEIDNYLSKKYPDQKFILKETEYTKEYDGIIEVRDKATDKLLQRWIVEVKIRNFSPNRERKTYSLKIKKDKWRRLLLNKKFLDVEFNISHKIMWYNTTFVGAFMIELIHYESNHGWNWVEREEDKWNVVESEKIQVYSDYIDLNCANYLSVLKTGDLD